MMVSKEEVRRIMAEVDALDLPDGAHWMMVHERLGLEYGEVFDIIGSDPEFFGYAPADPPVLARSNARQHRRTTRRLRPGPDDVYPIPVYPEPMTTETAAPLVHTTSHPAPDHFSGGGGSSGGAGASGSWDSGSSDSGSSSSDSGGGSSDGGGGSGVD